MLLNEFSRNKWEVVVSFLLFLFDHLLLLRMVLVLDLLVVVNEVLVDCLLANALSILLKLVQLPHIVKEFFLLLPLDLH